MIENEHPAEPTSPVDESTDTTDYMLSGTVRHLRSVAAACAKSVIAPVAHEVDERAEWPAASMEALADAGLMGLHVPKRLGGHEQGLLALAVLTETIGQACSSTAMCFGMHCVGTAVIAAKATPDHERRFLIPIAEGSHITTLALSESGGGAYLYLPATELRRDGDDFVVSGTKQFITNGAHADSYVISTVAADPEADLGDFSCLVLEAQTPNVRWLEAWHGLGMRGNSSRGLQIDRARVPAANLLGEVGDQVWYVFEVVAPYFLMAMSGTYLGVARAALELSRVHLTQRRYDHTGQALADVDLLQSRFAELWADLEKTRLLVYHAAMLGDHGDPRALPAILACKASVAETAVRITNEAMTFCGGMAYRENSSLARLLRDARASHVMTPTTDLLRLWGGRALLGRPLL